MKPTAGLLSDYFRQRFGADKGSIRIVRIGRGSHGQGYRVEFKKDGVERRLIVKRLEGGIGLGHDYPSDRAAVFLLAMDNYGSLPRHVRAVDVVSLSKDKGIFSVAGGSEYYLVMEEAGGVSYFRDLAAMRQKSSLDSGDAARVRSLASYLARTHAKKKDAPALYLRKIRDTIGHGECLMGVLDTYDWSGFTNLAEMADIEKACVDRRSVLKPLYGRLARIHGDFHPGNIMFTGPRSFVLLDRSRGEYGEPADDTTALCINYIFFSLLHHGRMHGAYRQALAMFHDEYISATGDAAVLEVSPLFLAFRGVVVANPLFYPDVPDDVRRKIFGFVHGVLASDKFDPEDVDSYVGAGIKYRRRFF